jgi:hypothetical protein
MPPYGPCWCRSGRKFKFCHYRRSQQEPINVFEEEQKMLAEFRRAYCSHPEAGAACNPKITNAQTIQRRGGLAAIAEAGHVLTVKPTLQALFDHQGMPPPRRIGVGRASVFPGFCNAHDAATFKPIEMPEVALDLPSAFLFAYRAIAYERFTKAAALGSLDIHREADRGKPFPVQAMVQCSLHSYASGLKSGMHGIDAWKQEYDERLASGDRSGFSYFVLRFDRVLPIVSCGAFYPEYDFTGRALQRLSRNTYTFEHLSLSVTTFAGRTVAFFGWLGDDAGPAGRFVASFRALPDERKADALIRLAFEHLENIYLTPSWWEALSPERQATLTRVARSGTVVVAREADCLIDRGSRYASAAIVETSP